MRGDVLVGRFWAVVALAWLGAADNQAADNANRAGGLVEREALVRANLTLSETETRDFVPLYREYRYEVGKLNDLDAQRLSDVAGQLDSLSRDQADELIDAELDRAARRLELERRLVKRLRRVLPDVQTALYLLTERRLDARDELYRTDILPVVREPLEVTP